MADNKSEWYVIDFRKILEPYKKNADPFFSYKMGEGQIGAVPMPNTLPTAALKNRFRERMNAAVDEFVVGSKEAIKVGANNELVEKNTALEAKVKDLEAKNKELKITCGVQANRIAHLNRMISKRISDAVDLKAKIKDLENEVDRYKKLIDALENEVEKERSFYNQVAAANAAKLTDICKAKRKLVNHLDPKGDLGKHYNVNMDLGALIDCAIFKYMTLQGMYYDVEKN